MYNDAGIIWKLISAAGTKKQKPLKLIPMFKKIFSKKKKKMPPYLIALIVVVFLFIAWVAYGYFGSRVERLKYTVIDDSKEYEIRLLDDHIIAETKVSGGFAQSGREGFPIIAGYIFGENKSRQKIAMTTPVIETEDLSEPIAMTAPVIEEEGENTNFFSFVMPSGYTMETLPEPIDKRITIREVKGKKIAVLTFGGFYTDEKFEKKKAELIGYLERDGITYSNLSSVGYNPPWTPPFMRRIEVWAEIIE